MFTFLLLVITVNMKADNKSLTLVLMVISHNKNEYKYFTYNSERSPQSKQTIKMAISITTFIHFLISPLDVLTKSPLQINMVTCFLISILLTRANT